MQKKQDKIVEMLKRISSFYKRSKDALAALVALVALFEQIDDKIALIAKLKLMQSSSSVGLTAQKNAYRHSVQEKALEIISGIDAYAQTMSDFVLKAEINMGETYLKNLGDNDFKSKMEIVYNTALKYAAEISDYGVTAEKVAAFKIPFDMFSAAIGSPKEIVIGHKGVTNQIDVVLEEAMKLLKITDSVMNTIRFSNAVLFAEYESNRQIESTVRSYSARVNVADAETANPIEGARVEFVLDGETVLEKFTALKGGINIKTLDEGTYTVTVSKIGYQPETVIFIVSDTESSYLEVKLRKQT